MTGDQVSSPDRRLERLIKSGICPAEDSVEYAQELKGFVDQIMEKSNVKLQSRFFKALSDITRIKILKLLSLRRMCVCEIMVALDLTQPTASHHLRILENVGILKDEREGKWIFYSIANPKTIKALEEVEDSISIG